MRCRSVRRWPDHPAHLVCCAAVSSDTKRAATKGAFREIQEAYSCHHPETRARTTRLRARQQPLAAGATGAQAERDFEINSGAVTCSNALHHATVEPASPAIFSTELETLLGRPREHLEFTIWYLVQRKYLIRDDQSRLMITAEGVDYLEQNYKGVLQRKRLQGTTETPR